MFLVVVDVGKKKAYWHFLQPDLQTDQSWRKKKSITIHVPVSNDLSDTPKFEEAILAAKRTMRLLHPESVHDSIAAHRKRVQDTDPRFDLLVTAVNGKVE